MKIHSSGRLIVFLTFLGSTNWKSFGQVKSENIGQGDKPDYFTSKGTVIFLRKENCMYMVSYCVLNFTVKISYVTDICQAKI